MASVRGLIGGRVVFGVLGVSRLSELFNSSVFDSRCRSDILIL